MEFNQLIENAMQRNASDIHIAVNHPPAMRVYGEIIYLRIPELTKEQVTRMIHSCMNEEQKAIFEREWEIDFSFKHEAGFRMRVNLFNNIHGPAAAMRIIPLTIKSLEELSAPPILQKITTNISKGMILVTGPTGSGKSTTMAAMIDHINKNSQKHILIIEDPIEFTHKSHMCIISQREIGMHSKSFARALKSALREDPDIIMVGEMRDLETIQLALTAAETGHLVIGTLHTNTAASTVDRIVDVFPAEDKPMVRSMLSNSLEAVISQRLIRKADMTGMVAAHEVMLCNSAIRNLIRESKIQQIPSIMQTNAGIGMQLMKDALLNLSSKGIIDNSEALQLLNASENNMISKVGIAGSKASLNSGF
ncbi:type IV pilus twitching motility protein PilT [Rickettsiales endosymbiont of Stachyamoeba lipophora]|uniref:type IV pilus twitching motility protein PilT n=1 Tax=Rickettsiales endosymbiont of Stachyamoeba lipophora TaxID=2486578 RepID=UPI000F64D840|nr:type IV pilus twitching motility protein PilT [Rickettsiales endosymbiont of Stachyamoeba lipophora]AZL16289.1 type IV pilus twitching motility protein PilT [Rickettsiales endosymbiont of Stachyamoeba lipophora]